MSESEIINYWKSLITNKDTIEHWDRLLLRNEPDIKVPESFFSCFRPDGEGVEKVFSIFEAGDEIINRAKEIFAATSNGYDAGDWYFIVKNPPEAGNEHVLELAKQYMKSLTEMAVFIENPDLISTLGKIQEIKIVENSTETPKNTSKLDSEIYDLICEFNPYVAKPLKFLVEPLYQMTCLNEIVYYIIWSVFRKAYGLADPYKAFVELWKLNYEVHFDDYNKLIVYLK